MTLNELRAALGTEILVVVGNRESGYVKYHATLDNVTANTVYSVGNTDSTTEITASIPGPKGRTVQIKVKRAYFLSQEAQIDTKVARLNASIAQIDSEDI